jgi:hypothetical protein
MPGSWRPMVLLFPGRSCTLLAHPCGLLQLDHCAESAHSCLVQDHITATALRCSVSLREVRELPESAAQEEMRAQAGTRDSAARW